MTNHILMYVYLKKKKNAMTCNGYFIQLPKSLKVLPIFISLFLSCAELGMLREPFS